MNEIKNIFKKIPKEIPDEIFQEILSTDKLKIERILSKGHASPKGNWYDQNTNEWIILLKGKAKLAFKESKNTVELTPGDYINIPSHVKHRVEWTDPSQETIWLAIHYG
ncbi:MAG TPA: cupin domain-containing protein [Desulfobacterales bacterium]|nr:cupin domain-containing protein [Desulfobacterales bacterium]